MAGALNATRKLIEGHLVAGRMEPGEEIALRIDQTLTQDATGTLVMLELEAIGLDRVKTEVSVQYVDHNLIQEDHRNADDHRFLWSACRRWGIWYSPAGNGISHPVHQQHFGKPGKTLLGSDSHTPAAGALGMLAIGAGGVEVALAMAGEPFHLRMPEVWGVELTGRLPDWVSAKDVILEMLRRHGVRGGRGRVIEYFGEGLGQLSAWDRHVIANMGTELGATTTVFPSDGEARRFLRVQGRVGDWREVVADAGAAYDVRETLDLSALVPLVALPSSPGRVVPVREVEGAPIAQAYVGSSANPGHRDLAVAAAILKGRKVAPEVSFDVNPSSRQVLAGLVRDGHLLDLVEAGARIHQAGCNGCIGMGQAPATDTISLRTVPRNFPGRSGTREDRVHLVSPETAAASALAGRITDPRDLPMEPPRIGAPVEVAREASLLVAPLPEEEARAVALVKGPDIASLPAFDPLPDVLEIPVLLVVGDDVSTDEILPAGARILPWRSNIDRISDFAFEAVDPAYARRAREGRGGDGHALVAGENYGQGSSREHAALAPRHLGLRVVLARSFARIHAQNLVNFGVLPLEIDDVAHGGIEQGDLLRLEGLREGLAREGPLRVRNMAKEREFPARHRLSGRQVDLLLRGGVLNWLRERRARA